MAHFALTDEAGGRFRAFERFSRGSTGLAGAQAGPFRVWLEDWQVVETEPDVVRMQAGQGDVSLDLVLANRKEPSLQGDRGFSAKGPQPGNASYYYSLTRIETVGEVRLGDAVYQVTGLSWMDHEWSTSALSPDQVGWDWFSIQMDDGSELMVFQIRKEDGRIDGYSSGTLIEADGSTRSLGRGEFEIRVRRSWRSPQSGATYPAGWTVTVPSEGLTLEIEPYLANQELDVSYVYWEGAVDAQGERNGRRVQGQGYVELTGYATSMQGVF
jgi:predicted secreted hydrolase